MPKLIPSIYFYVVSLIGLILLIIGVFSDVHYFVNVSSGSVYPLPYSGPERCVVPVPAISGAPEKQTPDAQKVYQDCLKSVEEERRTTQRNDLEKALSYTIVGAIVFGIHFYFARKQK
jgi:hypothetical protein